MAAELSKLPRGTEPPTVEMLRRPVLSQEQVASYVHPNPVRKQGVYMLTKVLPGA